MAAKVQSTQLIPSGEACACIPAIIGIIGL